jgi:hypothetical protein
MAKACLLEYGFCYGPLKLVFTRPANISNEVSELDAAKS